MADDYNPEEFSVRVSPGLFEVLARRASEAIPVEPRTARENALVEAVRKDEERKRNVMVRSLKEQSAREAVAKMEIRKQALERETAILDEKLQNVTVNLKASADELPCARSRKETLECLRAGERQCEEVIEAFKACAQNSALRLVVENSQHLLRTASYIMTEALVRCLRAAWTANAELEMSLRQVTGPMASAAVVAPGMLSVVGHYEFRDGARFRLRYSVDPQDSCCFIQVEDDVGLHFGFLDDINAYLLDATCEENAEPHKIIAAALAKAVKIHRRVNAATPSSNATLPVAVAALSGRRKAGQSKSAAYRIEDHPLAAMLAAHKPKAGFRARARLALREARNRMAGGGGAGELNVGGEGLNAKEYSVPERYRGAAANAMGGMGNSVGESNGGNAAVAGNNGVVVAAGGAAAASAARHGSEGSDKKRNETCMESSIYFGCSQLASTTLMKQLRILSLQDTRTEGFEARPKEDDLYTWHVKLFFDDPDTCLGQDLAELPNYDHLDLEFKFPSSYPCEPPVVRFLAPSIRGGHVTISGAICMELLTAAGWSPVNSIDVVCIQIRALLLAGNARVDVARPHNTSRYTLEGALRDLSSIVFSHGWTVENGRVGKSAKRAKYPV